MRIFKNRSTLLGLLAILSLTSWLISCASGPSKAQLTSQLYQPSYLYLQAGQQIQTKEGLYNPQQNETWVSSAKYAELEREVVLLQGAVAKLQSQQTIGK